MRSSAVALAGMLAVILAWYTWRAPEIVVPKATPPARQAIESEAKFESGSESVSESESMMDTAHARVSNSPNASFLSLQADGSREESPAATVDQSDSPISITKELPPYLEFYAAQRDSESKCMNPLDLLGEMRELERNEAWAARTEENLKDLLAPHPLGFPVTITCGGGICQITDLGPNEEIREREVEYDRYWGELQQRLYHVEPLASELATLSVVYAPYPEDTSQSITAFILTTKARLITADALDCPSLNVPKIK